MIPPSKETLKRWRSEEPTLFQRKRLKLMGLSWDKINTLSKFDAHKLIEKRKDGI